ncbi:MAG: hypothetical protein KBS83_08445 [Lachnospiraceae bacterium]|nr:hypothetical protein [Candidatus Equihabitans merdae]
MLALYINETKALMGKLLTTNAFDTFLLREGTVTTFCTYTIDGSFRESFMGESEDEQAEAYPAYAPWEMVRPNFFDLIKGKRTPLNMKLVFQLNTDNLHRFLERVGLDYDEGNIHALFMNLIYDGKRVMITTGSSQKNFPPNRDIDRAWDDAIKQFLKKLQLDYDMA